MFDSLGGGVGEGIVKGYDQPPPHLPLGSAWRPLEGERELANESSGLRRERDGGELVVEVGFSEGAGDDPQGGRGVEEVGELSLVGRRQKREGVALAVPAADDIGVELVHLLERVRSLNGLLAWRQVGARHEVNLVSHRGTSPAHRSLPLAFRGTSRC